MKRNNIRTQPGLMEYGIIIAGIAFILTIVFYGKVAEMFKAESVVHAKVDTQ